MKNKSSAVLVAQAVCALLLSGSRVSDAGKDSFNVPYGPTEFVVDRYDDGRNNPYVITFTDFEVRSVFEFDKDGFVTAIRLDEQMYNPVSKNIDKRKQAQRDYSRPHLAGRNIEGGADETGEEAIYYYKSNDKVNQEKRSYRNLRQPSHNDEYSAALRGGQSPALQTLERHCSRRHPANRGVKVGEGNSDQARGKYTLFGYQTAAFSRDTDANADESRPSRMDQARIGGGGGDTVVDIAMPFSHVAATLRRDADAASGSPSPSSMSRSSVEDSGADTDAGIASILRRMADAEWDTSSVSGKDLEEHRPDVTRRGPDKCEDCQQTWDTLCDNGVDTVCTIEEDDGQVVSAAIEESINLLCVGFSMVCSERSALDVCDGMCEEGQDNRETQDTGQDYEEEREQGEKDEECLPPLTITFEWTPLSELQLDEYDGVGFVNIYVIEPEGRMVYWNNPKTNAGYLTSTENKASYTLSGGRDGKRATGTYIAYAELWFGSHPISWTATATAGSGEVLFVEIGVFIGDRLLSSTGTRDTAREGMFLRGTTRQMYADLAEYVDNECKDRNVDKIDHIVDKTPNLMVW